jgi:hypothetical protein
MIPLFVLDNTHIACMNLGNASREQVAAETWSSCCAWFCFFVLVVSLRDVFFCNSNV